MSLLDAPFALVRRLLPKRPVWFYALVMAVAAVVLAAAEWHQEGKQRQVDRLLEDI